MFRSKKANFCLQYVSVNIQPFSLGISEIHVFTTGNAQLNIPKCTPVNDNAHLNVTGLLSHRSDEHEKHRPSNATLVRCTLFLSRQHTGNVQLYKNILPSVLSYPHQVSLTRFRQIILSLWICSYLPSK